MDEMIVDADDMIAGRLASEVAKMLLNGNNVKVVNAGKSIIVGDPVYIIKKYREKVTRGDPYHGPFYPKIPGQILRRIIRGMINYHKPMGRAAFRRLKVYDGLPEELKGKEIIKIKRVENRHMVKYISLRNLSARIGGKAE